MRPTDFDVQTDGRDDTSWDHKTRNVYTNILQENLTHAVGALVSRSRSSDGFQLLYVGADLSKLLPG